MTWAGVGHVETAERTLFLYISPMGEKGPTSWEIFFFEGGGLV